MKKKYFFTLLFLFFFLIYPIFSSNNQEDIPDIISHNLIITLNPQTNSFKASDIIKVKIGKPNTEKLRFLFGPNFKIEKILVNNFHVKYQKGDFATGGIIFVIILPKELRNKDVVTIYLKYSGKIKYKDYAEIDSKFTLLRQNIFLLFNWQDLYTGKFTFIYPGYFKAAACGKIIKREILYNGDKKYTWKLDFPSHQIFIASPDYIEELRKFESKEIRILLTKEFIDKKEEIADTAKRGLSYFSYLFSKYPFDSFQIIENIGSSHGFGELGAIIIPLDKEKMDLCLFIIHELSHQWWGNIIEMKGDNDYWHEGLAKFSEMLYIEKFYPQELLSHRLKILEDCQKYIDPQREFPIIEYDPSLADDDIKNWLFYKSIAYFKSSYIFVMLREYLGDKDFFDSLKHFCNKYFAQKASWEDLKESFEETSTKDLDWFFDQWLKGTGTPDLKLTLISLKKKDSGYEIKFKITQLQKEGPFKLIVPVEIDTEKGKLANTFSLDLREVEFVIESKKKPKKLSLDPEYLVFRKINIRNTEINFNE